MILVLFIFLYNSIIRPVFASKEPVGEPIKFIHHRQGQGGMSNDNELLILSDLRKPFDGNPRLVLWVLRINIGKLVC